MSAWVSPNHAVAAWRICWKIYTYHIRFHTTQLPCYIHGGILVKKIMQSLSWFTINQSALTLRAHSLEYCANYGPVDRAWVMLYFLTSRRWSINKVMWFWYKVYVSNPVVFGAAAGQREFWSCARHQHPFVDAGPILGPAFYPSPPGPTFFFFPKKKKPPPSQWSI